MKQPLLLLQPSFLMDRRNTPLSLWEGSPVSIINGQYGLAWETSEEASVIDLEPYILTTPFTIVLRTRIQADTAGQGFSLSPDWDLPRWAAFNFNPQIGNNWSYVGDNDHWTDIEWNVESPAGSWSTIAYVVEEDSVRVFENGVERSVTLWNDVAFTIEGDMRRLVLGPNL